MRRVRSIAAVLLALALAGCQGKQPEPVELFDPVDRDLAQQVRTPSLLVDVERQLGPAHAPTPVQQEYIQESLQRMPERMRKDAEADRTLAWGNDQGFLVVKVNSKGNIWVSSTRFGGPRPAGRSLPPIPPPGVEFTPPSIYPPR